DAALGVFIPLIVVNCIIFGRAEAFAFKNKPIPAIVDGLGMGIGFTIAITLISAVRELFGAGTLLGVQVMPAGYMPMDLLVKPAGGFIVLGLMLALMNKLLPKKA
ncbi:MAG: Rnf-Nqr domain containing protein, partial [Candidatus Ventricola sp.]